jgi:guanine deaminase
MGKKMTNNDSFMEEALKEAKAGIRAAHGGPFGAVVMLEDRIVGRGHNMVVESNDPTAHAEIVAIRQASLTLERYDLSDCILYTTCEPCPMCMGAILWARIKMVVYGCTRQDAADIGFDDSHFYDIVCGRSSENQLQMVQQDRDPCLKLFHKWQYSKTKTLY